MYVASGPLSSLRDRILGHNDGSNAQPGEVGEYVSNSTIGTNLTSTQGSVLGVINLTPGDWDVTGQVSLTFQATTSYTILQAGISCNLGLPPLPTLPPAIYGDNQAVGGPTVLNMGNFAFPDYMSARVIAPATVPGLTTPVFTLSIPMNRLLIPPGSAYPIVVGVVANCTFSAGTLTAGGTIRARRVR